MANSEKNTMERAQQILDAIGSDVDLKVTRQETEEHTGGSSSYYMIRVEKVTTDWNEPYWAECNDIIEALEMNYAEGNAFKALWRKAAARKGKKKKGNTALYDAEKVAFFGNRLIAQETD